MGLFDSIKALFTVKENKCESSKSNQFIEIDTASPFSIAGFVVKSQDEAALKKLIDRYTTPDTEQVFCE